MTELILKRLPNGQIKCEMEGGNNEIAVMICQAMIGNIDVTSVILGAIPTFLDEKGLSREGYCKTVMEAHGSKHKIKKQEMKVKESYVECAKKHETLFRLILDEWEVPHQELTIEQIHEKYSEGNRYGIWTILNFKEIEPNIFHFSQQDIATLSGSGSTEKYTMEDGKLKHIGSGMRWMS